MFTLSKICCRGISSIPYRMLSSADHLILLANDAIQQPFKDADEAVQRLCTEIKGADNASKLEFIRILSTKHGVNFPALDKVTKRWQADNLQNHNLADNLIAAKRISDASFPVYKFLFEKIARTDDGIAVLVDIRTQILSRLLNSRDRANISDSNDVASLRFMSNMLKELFLLWFSPALLQLQQLSWEHSPGNMLEAVARSQAVHPIRSWTDLKRRLHYRDRRCFVFTHPTLPSNDPIIVLYIALMSSIPSTMKQILGAVEDQPPALSYDTAVFYSIASQIRGLDGIDLGHSLIKRVLGKLRGDPSLKQFCTLSPVPGFFDWLNKNFKALTVLGNQYPISEIPQHIKNAIRENSEFLQAFGDVLLALAARYICLEKHRGFALDPVAHFHLRNGAEIYRINWLGDTSVRGLLRSTSIMVNYRYVPEDLELNAKKYAAHRVIKISPEVEKLCAAHS